MSAPPTILIAGAGIGGLALALALARKGFGVTLFEKRSRFEEAGAGIQLSPNASGPLIGLGLSSPLSRRAVTPDALRIRRLRDGKAIGTMATADAKARYGSPFWVIRRADLQTVLLDAVRAMPNIRLQVGRELLSQRQTETGVAVTVLSETGSQERHEGAALIGADGLWSRVRSLMGETHPNTFTGYEAWRTLIPAAQAGPLLATPSIGLWLGPDAHVVHYPVAGGNQLNLVLLRKAQQPHDDWSRPGTAADLAPLTATTASALRAVLEQVTDWQVWSLFDRPRLQSLAKGRLALIGDAAHPTLPFLAQGGAMAIEDAAVMAELLARSPDDPIKALGAYDKARMKRTERIQKEARNNARSYHFGWPLSMVRDRVVAHLGPEGMLARYDWLYGWKPDAA